MEGTVTISIKDFDELRRQKDIVEYVKRVVNESISLEELIVPLYVIVPSSNCSRG